jgi:hypothetical protein
MVSFAFPRVNRAGPRACQKAALDPGTAQGQAENCQGKGGPGRRARGRARAGRAVSFVSADSARVPGAGPAGRKLALPHRP